MLDLSYAASCWTYHVELSYDNMLHHLVVPLPMASLCRCSWPRCVASHGIVWCQYSAIAHGSFAYAERHDLRVHAKTKHGAHHAGGVASLSGSWRQVSFDGEEGIDAGGELSQGRSMLDGPSLPARDALQCLSSLCPGLTRAIFAEFSHELLGPKCQLFREAWT